MAQLSSRLIISLIDRVSGPARGISGSLKRLHAEARATPFVVAGREAQRAGQHFMRAGTSAAAGAYGLYRFITAVKDFNEAEFGYSFARLPDHFKGMKLDMESLRKDTEETTRESRKLAKELGLIPTEVQRARTEVEKIGIKGSEGDSLWRAALGLNMSDADMPTDTAAKFLGAMYRSYADQRRYLAQRMGVDMNDQKQVDWFNDNWLRGMAAKSGVAAAKSALDPRELIEGARQYAPLWASLGMRPEETLGALAHGSNYGFMATELGTSFKSWANRLVKPTNAGVDWANTLGMDRSKWTSNFGAVAPTKAVTRINSLLGMQAFAGKGGKEFRSEIRAMLDNAAKTGTTTMPEFQAELSKKLQDRLGKGWAGRGDEIAEAVRNATLTGDGDINVLDFIREANKKNISRAAMLEILEGRHVARSEPLFRFFDDLVKMVDDLDKTGAQHLDAIEIARRESRAGKLTALQGAWDEFMLSVQDSGALDGITAALTGLAQAMSSIGPGPMKAITMLATLGIVLAPLSFALAGVISSLRALYAIAVGFGGLLGAGRAASAAGGGMAGLFGAGAGGVAAGMTAKQAGKALGRMGSATAAGRMIGGMSEVGAASLGAVATKGPWAKFRSLFGTVLPSLVLGGLIGSAGDDLQATLRQKKAERDGTALGDTKLWSDYLPRFSWLFGSEANAAERPGQTITNAGSAVANGETPGARADVSAIGSAAQAIPGVVSSAMGQVRSILAGVDLTAEGQRIMQSLANGMRAGLPAVQGAASAAAGAAAGGALRGSFTDGGR